MGSQPWKPGARATEVLEQEFKKIIKLCILLMQSTKLLLSITEAETVSSFEKTPV